MKIIIDVLFVCTVLSYSLSYHVQGSIINECNCHCSKVFKNEGSVCKNLFELKEQVDHVTIEIEKRTKHIGDLSDLMERMGLHEIEFKKLQKVVDNIKYPTETTETIVTTTDINALEDVEKETIHSKEMKELKERLDEQEVLYKNLLKVVEDFKKSKENLLPKPQSLVSEMDDNMMGDSSLDTRSDGSELAKNMSDLLAKVEVVENLTSKVQEELKSERRVRRHLEEDLNETRTSIKLLNDKLVNASLPMENRNDLVEELTLSTLENINRTLFEEQLSKFHYLLDDVAYKNETKYLYEHVDNVRDSLLNVSSGNVLLFEEEFRSLSDMVTNLSENVTVQLTLEEIRLNALETKATEIDVLDGQLDLLMNSSELIHSGIEEMWKDIQDIRNDTVNMKKNVHEKLGELDNVTQSFMEELSQKLENVTSDISEKLKNATLEMSNMKTTIAEGKAPITALYQELALVAEDLTNVENRIDHLGISTDNKLKDISLKVQNVTEVWSTSLVAITEQIMRDKRAEKLVSDPTCELPNVIDDHLLMSIKNDSTGQSTLEFGCRPIGKYILNTNSSVLTCIDGMWNGPIPECTKLLEEEEIDNIEAELRNENPCKYSFGNSVPDPVDCAYYFQCAPGTARRMKCPPGHHFSSMSKMCEPAYSAFCHTDISSHDKLSDLIPTILIDPDSVDKTYGMMGTGPTGQLIVHPRTTFTLHCLFPDSAWGTPSWRFLPGYSTGMGDPLLETTLHYSRLGTNRYAVSIIGASSLDSGTYMCVSPRGKFNSIHVVVKSVQCPPITPIDGSLSNAYYRPHPEGESRILSTQVEFQCRGGFSVTATCRADGTWSRPAPTPEECLQESSFWDCPPIDTTGHPNLMLERDDRDLTVTFKCSPGSRLIGIAFSRCFQGKWTHTSLPRCDWIH